MLRKKAETITDILHAYLRGEGLETPLNELRAVEAWERIAPPAVQRYVRKAEVRNGTLHVSLTNPSLRANMMMTRAQLLQRINAEVGAQAINNIIFQ